MPLPTSLASLERLGKKRYEQAGTGLSSAWVGL